MIWLKHHININSKMYSQAALVCGYMFALCASLFYKQLWDDAYYHLNEGAFSMYLMCVYLQVSNNSQKWSKNWQSFSMLVFLSSVSTLADEIATTANIVSTNDLYRFIAIIVFVLIVRIRKGKQHGCNE
ncbi:MAG: hypothetical protein ACI9N9_000097 [Enterobacterales bacterium]|jgi:hypothetical protein